MGRPPIQFSILFQVIFSKVVPLVGLTKKKVTGVVILWGGRGKSETNYESLLTNKCETWIVMNKLCSVG